MAKLNLEFSTARFNAMLRELAKIDSTVEFATVVRSEAGAVAQLALDNTKAAMVSKIKARSDAQKFTTYNGKTYFIHRNYRNAQLAAALIESWNKTRERRLGARGISKQSWLYVGRSLGRPMKAPAYVEAASFAGKTWPEDGTSSEAGSKMDFRLTITNASPVVQKANGGFALQVAMNRRSAYFTRNMNYRFYETVANRALKYPGIFVSAPPVPIADAA